MFVSLYIFLGFGNHWCVDFCLLPFVFDQWHESTESFVLIVSLLIALMGDQIVKLGDIQVGCLMILHF